jgi:phosphomannomutase
VRVVAKVKGLAILARHLRNGSNPQHSWIHGEFHQILPQSDVKLGRMECQVIECFLGILPSRYVPIIRFFQLCHSLLRLKMPEPIISISGLRGIVGAELTPIVASNFTAAFCSQAPDGPIALARDGRISGPMFADAIAAAIVGHGRECWDLGVASTPTVGAFVRESESAGAIQISASHNPPAYNGMKLFSPEGRVLPNEPGTRVLNAYRRNQTDWRSADSLGVRRLVEDPHDSHLQLILATVDVEAIQTCRFRVLLDSNHGAGSLLGRRLLEALGCDFLILGETPDGQFSHPPEPLAENLVTVSPRVAEHRFQIGFCQDPDADRLAIIDETGHFIGEEYTSVLCMKRALMLNSGPLVTNCASSGMTKWLAAKYGVRFEQSKVGEANVVDTMLRHKAMYGGEGSGGPIDPRVGYIRDSFVGMAQVLDLLAATKSTLSQLVSELPRLAMIKDKIVLSKEQLSASIARLLDELKAESVGTEDGIRLDWADSWLLLRGSNTEPIVRLIAETPSDSQSRELIARAKQIIAS